MCLARHKGRKKTLALPNRPKPFGVMRSLTDEFVRTGKLETGNWELGTGSGRVALLRDREEWGMGRFVPVAQERDPPMGPVGASRSRRSATLPNQKTKPKSEN